MIRRFTPIFLLALFIPIATTTTTTTCPDLHFAECPDCPIPTKGANSYECPGAHWLINKYSEIDSKNSHISCKPATGEWIILNPETSKEEEVLSAMCVNRKGRMRCEDLKDEKCEGCKTPLKDESNWMYTCSEKHWLINHRKYVSKEEPITCKPDNRGYHMEWQTASGTPVTKALCLEQKLCDVTAALDTFSVLRQVQPEITSKTVSCTNKTKLHVIFPGNQSTPVMLERPIECDGTTGRWMRAKGYKGRDKVIPKGAKVFCEDEDFTTRKTDYQMDSDDDDTERKRAWSQPLMIAFGLWIILFFAIPIAYVFAKCTDPRLSMDEELDNEVWSIHWNEDPDDNEWDWQIVVDFVAAWNTKSVEEKTNFLEIGYSELGYESNITQMLYIFEYMIYAEKNHLVWRPMMNFLIRLKRLAHPPYSEVDLAYKFNSWLSWQGKKIIDEYWYYADEGDEEDVKDSFIRYVGVFLMTLGDGGRLKNMFKELDGMVAKDIENFDNPVRAAIWANRIMRDEGLTEFERLWDILTSLESTDPGSEWGSKMDHVLFALGHILAEEPSKQLTDFMLKSKKITAGNIVWWFRGATERAAPFHLPFFVKHHARLIRKMPVTSDAYYECLRMYCLFEQSGLGWTKMMEMAVKNDKLAKRLDVPLYQRRAKRVKEYYMAMGVDELEAWFKDPKRMADIEKCDYTPPAKVVTKPAH